MSTPYPKSDKTPDQRTPAERMSQLERGLFEIVEFYQSDAKMTPAEHNDRLSQIVFEATGYILE